MNDRKAYPSDLTDAEWEILEPLIPAISEEAAHVKYTRREIVNGILYVLLLLILNLLEKNDSNVSFQRNLVPFVYFS